MPYESSEDRIRHLEDELYRAWHTVFDLLLPDEVKEVANSYWRLNTRRDADEWQAAVAGAVIQLAWPVAQETTYFGRRADCPLCKQGTSGPYEEGFKLPDGLRMHLLGEGNAHQCEVMHAVFKLAKSVWLPKARDMEAAEEAEKVRVEAERRASERLYRTDPRSAPQLIDQHLGWGNGPRSEESLNWATARLEQLGFTCAEEGRVQQFTKDYGPLIVYADPREKGKITFRIFRREQVEKPKSRKRWSPAHDSFSLQDTWKNDLLKKLDERVELAIEALLKPRKRE